MFAVDVSSGIVEVYMWQPDVPGVCCQEGEGGGVMDVVTQRLQAVAMLILCTGIAVSVVCCGLSVLGVNLESVTVAVKEVGRE